MGNMISTYLIGHEKIEHLGGFRIGSNGSGRLLVEQWIAGWAVSDKAPAKVARIARSWLQYFGNRHSDLKYRSLRSRKDLEKALEDDGENCTWVQGYFSPRDGEPGLGRVNMFKVHDQQLHAMLCLWHATKTLEDHSPYIRVTEDLAKAVLIATERLEELVAPWAKTCRDACTLILRASEKGGYIYIG